MNVNTHQHVLAGVEMGGTKCVCTLGSGPDDIREQLTIATTDPQTTLGSIAALLEGWSGHSGSFDAIGVATFGPVDLDRGSSTYGRIGSTPKRLWQQVDVAGFFAQRFRVPVGLTTDVIGAALGEGRWGNAQGLQDYAYVTVGTGVGVGLIAGGRPVIGCQHPELGHARIVRMSGDVWPGNCAFHGDCIEGLASGPAIQARSGQPAANLSADDPVWHTVAHALGQLAHLLVVSVAPRKILIGGGVIQSRPELFPLVRRRLLESLNGYHRSPELRFDIDRFVGPPGLGSLAGPLGALAVAHDTFRDSCDGDAAAQTSRSGPFCRASP
jgi:fructokinase